jgi:DNA-binding MltR family transcriptional regulator
MTGKHKKLATSLLLQVFRNNDTIVVKNAVFPRLMQSVSTDLQQLR